MANLNLTTVAAVVWYRSAGYRMTWRSKLLRVPNPICPAALRIYAQGQVAVDLWADGVLVVEKLVVNGSNAVRLPSGYKAKSFQVQVWSNEAIDSIEIATSMKELT